MDEYYKTLGVEPGASPEEVRQAYKDLVNVWHPDRFSHDPHLQKKAQEELKKINEAYKRLETQFQSAPAVTSSAASGPTIQKPQQSSSEAVHAKPHPVSVWMWPLIVVVIGASLYFGLRREPASPSSSPLIEPYSVRIGEDKPKLPPTPNGQTASSPETIIARKRKEAEKWGGTGNPKTAPAPSLSKHLSYITVGSGKDDAIRIQGRPDSTSSNLFTYGSSHIYFEDGKVTGWQNNSPRLRVRLSPSVRSQTETFTVGSTKDEVLSVQGTPDSFSDREFIYGAATVHFDDGRVTSWFDRDSLLKVTMQPQQK
jgi:hypothetical protein